MAIDDKRHNNRCQQHVIPRGENANSSPGALADSPGPRSVSYLSISTCTFIVYPCVIYYLFFAVSRFAFCVALAVPFAARQRQLASTRHPIKVRTIARRTQYSARR